MLVTSYRQEQFVSSAVQAALAQDYCNLQIIFSDDCSPDGTFGALQRAVEGYDGPHRVIVRQTSQNLGVVRHFYDAIAVADGDLIMFAPADDISYAGRARRLVEAWVESGADAIMSDWDVIDINGEIVRHGRESGRADLRFEEIFPGQQVIQLTGTATAYSATALNLIPCPPWRIFEDLYLTLMLHWRGRRVHVIPDALIGYRTHDESATNFGRTTAEEWERAVQVGSAQMADAMTAFQEMMIRDAHPDDPWGMPAPLDQAALRQDIAFNRFRSGWLEVGIRARFAAFREFRNPVHRRWLWPRLLGMKPLELIKTVRAVSF